MEPPFHSSAGAHAPRRSLAALWVALALAATTPAEGQTNFYWERQGQSYNGNWDTSTANWNTNSGGQTGKEKFVSGGNAIFSAGTSATGAYSIFVSGTQEVSDIVVEEGNPIFNGGTVRFVDSTPTVTVNAGAMLTWGLTNLSSVTNSVTLAGSGIVNLAVDGAFNGTLNLSGGTLRLTGSSLSLGTLNITGNSTLDFAGSSSTLNLNTLNISAGVTLTVLNWAAASDYFYTSHWTGATPNTSGSAPMNQVVFNGYSGAATSWDAYDHRIRPNVPEPAVYGQLMVGLGGALLGWRRWRRSKRKAAART
ncbi:MAG: hypothetical protein JNG83_05690 [Opitutaceae bacterium]|nr:hypothetical protein [Opitutaceae bacterium]